MGLHLGSSENLKIATPLGIYRLIIPSPTPVLNGVTLLSFDNYILKDSNGVYLTAKEDD